MKLGLALGGGGAKGLAHIGVLKVFAKAGIDFQVVAGTSIGALVGAIYAARKLDRLEEELLSVGLTDIPGILSPSWSFGGLFSGKNVLERLSELLETDSFSDLSCPFAAIATDLQRASIVTLKDGNLHTAIRASISIPGVFTPVVLNESILVDGGVMEPVPVAAARNLGATHVLAIDLFSNRATTDERRSRFPLWPTGIRSAMSYIGSLSPRVRKRKKGDQEKGDRAEGSAESQKPLPHMIELIERTFAVSQIHITTLRLRENPADIILTPPVSDVGVLDFHRAQAIIARGQEFAEQELERVLAQLRREDTGG